MAQYTARVHHEAFDQLECYFAIDFPRVETFEVADPGFIAFRAWAFSVDRKPVNFVFDFNETHVIPANTNRPDVGLHFPIAPVMCGLHIVIPFHEIFKMGIISQDRVVWLATIELSPLMVLEGSNGYLFLDNDDNQSVEQYSGTVCIDSENVSNWENYFYQIQKRLPSRSFAFCLAPAKEYIFSDYYPIQRTAVTPHDQFVHLFKNHVNLINPLALLHQDRHLSYSKNDTHWTDYGAHLVAKEICLTLGVTYNDPLFSYSLASTTGDLGIKFNPQRTEPFFAANISHLNDKCFDNKIPVRGNILAFTNPNASLDETCLIFGSSSSTSIAIQLTSTFKRVVRVFSGADIDYDIIQHEEAKYIVVVFASRFLVRAPCDTFSTGTEILRKLQDMSAFDRNQIKQHNLQSLISQKDTYYSTLLQALSKYVE